MARHDTEGGEMVDGNDSAAGWTTNLTINGFLAPSEEAAPLRAGATCAVQSFHAKCSC